MKLTKNKLEQLITEELSKKLNENQDNLNKIINLIVTGNPSGGPPNPSPEAIRQGLVLAETFDYIFDFVESDLEHDPTKKARALKFNAYPEFAIAFRDVVMNRFKTAGIMNEIIRNFMMFEYPQNSTNPDYYKFYFNLIDPNWGEPMKFTPLGEIK